MGQAELHATFSRCQINTRKALSSLSFLSFSLQLQKLLVKSNPPVFVRERAKALLLYAFPGVTWALCYWLAVRDVKEKKYIQKVPFSWGELIEIHVFSSGLHSNAYKETVNISIKWSHSEPYENRWGIAVATKNWYSNYQPCIHRLQHCWLQYRIGCHMPSSPPLFE